jgi:hypothetical protein
MRQLLSQTADAEHSRTEMSTWLNGWGEVQMERCSRKKTLHEGYNIIFCGGTGIYKEPGR